MSFGPEVPVVVAASAPWATPAPVNAHQVARRLAARGHEVLFVESTGLRAPSARAPHDLRRVATRLRSFAGGVRAVAPNLRVLSPLALPGGGPRWLRHASLRALAAQVRRAARQLGMERPVLWAFLPTAEPVAAALHARLRVYHCVDHYAANPGVDRAWIDALEARMLRTADLVLASSPVLAERLRARRADAECWPNVADVALFRRAATEALEEPPELRGRPHPRAVYVGNVAAYRIDFALLEAAADAVATLVLVGAEGLGDLRTAGGGAGALRGRPEVLRLGARAPEALPPILRHCDVALVPFLDNEHTRGSLPLKLWEYLAAGLPVVARDLPNLGELRDEGLVHTGRNPQQFGAALRTALAEPSSARAERSARAAPHGWDARMDALVRRLSRALDEGTSSFREGTPRV